MSEAITVSPAPGLAHPDRLRTFLRTHELRGLHSGLAKVHRPLVSPQSRPQGARPCIRGPIPRTFQLSASCSDQMLGEQFQRPD